ncbi:phage tail protein [Latilactobacillus curvatus]|uniref:phage tail spike protein n=1 Tax=Latilactobacillus curvatus TaxID=28038 RepID=UPI0024115CA9|nr:phage tail spike protein [Latilactobacillus curvatus]MDG2979689.1 phage tail protein [Latilactobacillus curvatus]
MSYPVIYSETATDFFNLGLGTLPDATKVEVTEERNGEFTLAMTYLVDGLRASEIKKNRIIKVDAGHVLKDQRFVIKKINRQLVDKQLQLQVYAEHVSYITNDLQLKPNVTVNGSGDAAIKAWRSNIIDVNPLVVDSDIETNTSTTWTIDKVQSARQALGGVTGSLLDLWGGEYRFDNYHISLKKQRGTVANTLLSYGRNITDFDQEENITDTYTTVYPYATYTETTTTDDNASSESKLMTLPELTVDSEYVGNYPNRKILPVDLTSKFTDNEKPTIEKLREYAKAYVKSNSIGIPTVSIKLSYVDLSQSSNYEALKLLEVLDLCDTVPVRFSKLGVDTKTKVSRVVWDVLAEHYTSMELGDTRYTIGDMINNALNTANEANQNSQEAQNSANHAVVSADGHTMIFYGPNTPVAKNVGDLWYQPDGEYETMYRWDGVTWAFVMSTRDTADAQKAADAAQKEAEEAKNQANKAVDGANDAVTKAGFATDTATQAKSDAASALQKALDAYNHGDQIKTGLTADIDAVKGQVNLKSNQVDVDKLGGRVTNAEAQIKLQADQIALTVSKTELNNTLSSYATQTWTQGQIKTTADQINLSVTKVDSKVDNLNTSDRNLLIKSGTFETGLASDVTVSNNTYGGNRILMIPKSPADNTTHDPYVPIPSVDMVGTEYVLSFYLKADVNGDKFAVNLFSPNTVTYAINSQGIVTNTPTGGDGYSWFTATNTWVRYWVKYTQTSTNAKKKLIIGRTGTATIGKDNKGGFQLASPMLSEGNMTNKPWAAAPEDFATDTKFADLQITVNGIQGTVQNKADQSQVTQLSGQITSVVTSAANPNLIMNGGYPTTTEHWAGATDFAVTKHGFYRRGNLFVLGNIGTQEQNIGTDRVRVVAGAKYTISMIIFGSENVSSYDVWFLGRKNGSTANFDTSVLVAGAKKPIPNAAEHPNWTFTMPDVDEGYIRIDNNGTTNAPNKARLYFTEVKLEKGTMATPYIQSAESSEIIQTKEMINLRVEKDKIVNQINISTEGILIDGQKVHITGQTTIDNAVIKDAMIVNVKADKITAGTLNAATVNVINLNANNITTGTLKGTNLSMNLNTGEVLFQKGSIKSANGNLNLDISKGTMAVINEYKSGFYFEDGKLVLNDGWLEGTSSQPKYGSLEYNANYFTVNGLAVKGTEGVTIGTPGYNPSMEMMFSSVKESGIAIDRKHLEMGSVGPTIISSGNEFFMNLLTKQPFIAVGTTADGNFMTTDKPGSRISLYAEYVHIKSAYSHTASGSANLIVAEDGALVRSTSASKYKTDIIRTNIPDYGEKLLELPTATWTDIAETKRYRDDPVNQIKPTRNFGMIAEDLAEAGLEMLVVRGTDGELEGINYDRIGPALIPVIAKLKNEVETLKQKIGGKSA